MSTTSPTSTHSNAGITITLLPTSLSLVHIPRTRLPKLCNCVLKQILCPPQKFLNITCNELELSVFAEQGTLSELERIARREMRAKEKRGRRRKPRRDDDGDDDEEGEDIVEISDEAWNVLQIDTHDGDTSHGSRIRELSQPLAAAGISILYHSSYTSDFIFIRATDLPVVVSLLRASGFALYRDHTHTMSRVPSFIAERGRWDKRMREEREREEERMISSESGAVLSRTRSTSIASMVSLASLSIAQASSSPTTATQPTFSIPSSPITGRSAMIDPLSPTSPTSHAYTHPFPKPPSNSTSPSPTSAHVTLLPPDLVCVGLKDDPEHVAVWQFKLVHLVSFPELLSVYAPEFEGLHASTTSDEASEVDERVTRKRTRKLKENMRSTMMQRDDAPSNDSRSTNKSLAEALFVQKPGPQTTNENKSEGVVIMGIDVSGGSSGMENAGAVNEVGWKDGGDLTNRWIKSSSEESQGTEDIEGDKESEADGTSSLYFSGREPEDEEEDEDDSSSPSSQEAKQERTPELISGDSSSTSTSSGASEDGCSTCGSDADESFESSSSESDAGSSAGPEKSEVHAIANAKSRRGSKASKKSKSSSTKRTRPLLPSYFSFTRTLEGSSLTTDVRALCAMFSPHERSVVYCKDEVWDAENAHAHSTFDEEDDEVERIGTTRRKDKELRKGVFDVSWSGEAYEDESEGDYEEEWYEDEDSADADGGGMMSCLQIDLQKYGLDKHGLVNRFSRVLDQNGINHMYSSTYKTANLLVDKKNAARAQLLLRAC